MIQISDAPSQKREALFSLNGCFESKCIISYQPDIEDFKTTNVKYYCPQLVPIRHAIFDFGIPLVNLLVHAQLCFHFIVVANWLTVQKVSIQGQIIESRKSLKEWCRDYGTNKQNIVCERRSFIWHLTFAFENACP